MPKNNKKILKEIDLKIAKAKWIEDVRNIYGKNFIGFDYGGNENGATITAYESREVEDELWGTDFQDVTVGEFYEDDLKKSWVDDHFLER